jgi:hypothetical protein
MGNLDSLTKHFPWKSHHKPTVTAPPADVVDAEDIAAPACADLSAKMVSAAGLKNAKFENKADQPILNDNAQHLAPQYTCVYTDDGKSYSIGTSKEKAKSNVLFNYIVTEYTYDPETHTGDSKLSAHPYKAVTDYQKGLSKPNLKVIKTAKVFIYDDNQVRGGAFECNNVIVTISVDSDSTITMMNQMIAAALKDPMFKVCSK